MKDALEKARARRKKIQDEETPEKIENYGMKVVQGFASFKDEHTLLIDNKQEISANKIIISTGSHPRSCSDLDNVDTTKKLTNESIFEQEENIKKLVVVG
jgi:pyruvate/2-oxoglutarate dehydrogenase complex dihydrolipoamide dehydrogenase (E3) component